MLTIIHKLLEAKFKTKLPLITVIDSTDKADVFVVHFKTGSKRRIKLDISVLKG